MKLLSGLLRKFIRKGTLRVIDAQGDEHVFSGTPQDPVVTMKIHDKSVYTKLFFNPELALPEAYMDGKLSFEDGCTCSDFLYLFSINRSGLASHPVQAILRKVWFRFRRFAQSNPVGKAFQHVHEHYDISDDLYRLFLDKEMQYTCAYYLTPDDSLEQAQTNKMRHICAKLQLQDGMKVAELGCGWGGLSRYLAGTANVDITAVSLSEIQVRVANDLAEKEGVADRVHFKHTDYREMTGTYDRIVSIGMMEHLGAEFYDEFFIKVRAMLKPDGFAVIHAIGRNRPPGTTSPFLRKYIFPHGYVPALSEVFAAAERQDLWIGDCEIWRLHYYYTIREWHRRFMANWDKAEAMYDARFCRMMEFYLASVMLGFLNGANMNYQIIVAPKRDAVPIVRDYIVDDERALLKREQAN